LGGPFVARWAWSPSIGGRPCDLSGCVVSTNPFVSFAHRFFRVGEAMKEGLVREIGLDVHRDFCEVAIAEGGEIRRAGRVQATPEALELFARSFGTAAIGWCSR
jgi:hypothetical protein